MVKALLVFNVAMLVLDVLLLMWLARDRRPRQLAACLGVGALGTLMLLWCGDRAVGMFGAMSLAACAVFAHLPLTLLAAGWLFRPVGMRAAWGCGLAALALWAIAFDAFVIEPQALVVSEYRVPATKLQKRLRIVILADIQTDRVGEYERRVLREAMLRNPDLILMAGDYIHVADPAERERQIEALRAALHEEGLYARLGIHVVRGNVDAPGWQDAFAGLAEVQLYQETSTVQRETVYVTGLTLEDSSDTQLSVPAQPGFHIVLGHVPNFALGSVAANLMVAGHTHGGQVQLPGIGPLLTLCAVPRRWADGMTVMRDGRALIVSRGIGMERGVAPRMRFLCRPELIVVDLVPGGGSGPLTVR